MTLDPQPCCHDDYLIYVLLADFPHGWFLSTMGQLMLSLLHTHPCTVSCLVSGLLTIGPRFGGAIDDAARFFKVACDKGQVTIQYPGCILRMASC